MATYFRSSITVFNSKTSRGIWFIEQAPLHWNGVNAWAVVKDKNGKQYKIIIVNYFINN